MNDKLERIQVEAVMARSIYAEGTEVYHE